MQMFSNSVQSESILILGNFSPTAEKGEASEEDENKKDFGGKRGEERREGGTKSREGLLGEVGENRDGLP